MRGIGKERKVLIGIDGGMLIIGRWRIVLDWGGIEKDLEK